MSLIVAEKASGSTAAHLAIEGLHVKVEVTRLERRFTSRQVARFLSR
jgi:hypothetical protein